MKILAVILTLAKLNEKWREGRIITCLPFPN
jgi:hypothetical protein